MNIDSICKKYTSLSFDYFNGIDNSIWTIMDNNNLSCECNGNINVYYINDINVPEDVKNKCIATIFARELNKQQNNIENNTENTATDIEKDTKNIVTDIEKDTKNTTTETINIEKNNKKKRNISKINITEYTEKNKKSNSFNDLLDKYKTRNKNLKNTDDKEFIKNNNKNYRREHNENYKGNYRKDYNENYSQEYKGNYRKDYNENYSQEYNGNYRKDYNENYMGYYERDYRNNEINKNGLMKFKMDDYKKYYFNKFEIKDLNCKCKFCDVNIEEHKLRECMALCTDERCLNSELHYCMDCNFRPGFRGFDTSAVKFNVPTFMFKRFT
jgi:hypothetical protein